MSFPPQTEEVQFDEKWSFVANKEKNRDDHVDEQSAWHEDPQSGDFWDLVAFDPEYRLVVSAIVGRRIAENVEAMIEDFHRNRGRRVAGRRGGQLR